MRISVKELLIFSYSIFPLQRFMVVKMARKNQGNEDALRYILTAFGAIVFLPFMMFSYIHYNKMKRKYLIGDNVQRIFDVGLLWKSVIFSAGVVITGIIALYYINANILRVIPQESTKALLIVDVIVFLLALYPLKKMAERVAVRYFGVVFDDQHKNIIIPTDLENASLSDNLRLQFIKKMGDCEIIKIKDISSVTREKGINFFIHGAFGSRKINFTNKQKRDECLSALQARSTIRIGRDLGY